MWKFLGACLRAFPFALGPIIGFALAWYIPAPPLVGWWTWAMFMATIGPVFAWLLVGVLYATDWMNINRSFMKASLATQWVMFAITFLVVAGVPGRIVAAFRSSEPVPLRLLHAVTALLDPWVLATLLCTMLLSFAELRLKRLKPGFWQEWWFVEECLALYGTSWRVSRVASQGYTRFADPIELAKAYRKGPIVFGQAAPPPMVEEGTPISKWARKRIMKALGLTDDPRNAPLLRGDLNGHLAAVSGAGGGKSSSLSIPWCLTYPYSMLVVDPKGENALVTSRRRREMGQRVLRLFPGYCKYEKRHSDSCNVLAWLNPADPGTFQVDVVSTISNVMPDESDKGGGGDSGAAYYAERARAMGTALLGYVMLYWWHVARTKDPRTPRPTFRALYDLVFQSPKAMAEFIEKNAVELEKNPAMLGPLTIWIKKLLDSFRNQDEKLFATLVSSLTTKLWWLGVDDIMAMITGTPGEGGQSFEPMDIVDGKTTVFLNLPLKLMTSMPGCARLLVGVFLGSIFNADRDKVKTRVFAVIDEVQILGNFPILHEVGLSQGRGFGVNIAILAQSLEGLKGRAGETVAKEWQDNAVLQLYWNIGGADAANQLSTALGDVTIEDWNFSRNEGVSGSHHQAVHGGSEGTSTSVSRQKRPLRYPSEIQQTPREYGYALFRLGNSKFAKVQKRPAIIRMAYYKLVDEWKDWHDPNPFEDMGGGDPLLLSNYIERRCAEGVGVLADIAKAAAGGSPTPSEDAPKADESAPTKPTGDAAAKKAGSRLRQLDIEDAIAEAGDDEAEVEFDREDGAPAISGEDLAASMGDDAPPSLDDLDFGGLDGNVMDVADDATGAPDTDDMGDGLIPDDGAAPQPMDFGGLEDEFFGSDDAVFATVEAAANNPNMEALRKAQAAYDAEVSLAAAAKVDFDPLKALAARVAARLGR